MNQFTPCFETPGQLSVRSRACLSRGLLLMVLLDASLVRLAVRHSNDEDSSEEASSDEDGK